MDAHLWPEPMDDQENIGAETMVPDVHVNLLQQKKVRKYIDGGFNKIALSMCIYGNIWQVISVCRCQLVCLLLH